jgi:SAM-dependent methyltransferase
LDEIPPEIIRHYESNDEGPRINEGLGRLELLRTREILRRHLPGGPLRILDVGGATGVHAQWLAADGHSVHIVDFVPGHVERARGELGATGRVTAEVGDARSLPVPDHAFDAALVLGPLYHLTEAADRQRALSEARRAVVPGGLIFVAAISRFASLFDGLAQGFLFEPSFRGIVEGNLRDGQHRNPTNRPGWFTTAYFHHPRELREEAEAANLDVIEVVGVEGLAVWLPHLEEHWDIEKDRETILFSARVVEREEVLLGLSAHLILVARTPT